MHIYGLLNRIANNYCCDEAHFRIRDHCVCCGFFHFVWSTIQNDDYRLWRNYQKHFYAHRFVAL